MRGRRCKRDEEEEIYSCIFLPLFHRAADCKLAVCSSGRSTSQCAKNNRLIGFHS